jgi:hypothetical protein
MCDFELAAQEVQLALAMRLQVIEATLADGCGRMRTQPFFECGEILIGMLLQVTRMQAVRGMQSWFGGAKRLQLRPARRGHGGYQHFRDARRARIAQHPRAVGVEFRRVQMRVAVEEGGVWAKVRHCVTLEPNMNRAGCVDERFIVGLFESKCHQGP